MASSYDPLDPPDDAPIGRHDPSRTQLRRSTPPSWFIDAMAHAPERGTVDSDGVAIETLTWGEAGKPGLLLLHGNRAHADWYSFIAPFFARDYRVVATSWSGMGGSGWRDQYTLDAFVHEIGHVLQGPDLALEAGRDATGRPVKPAVVAHSFGGFPTAAFAARHGDRLRAAIIVDTPIMSTEMRKARQGMRPPGPINRPTLVYDSLERAMRRFRVMPEQPCENDYLVELIARRSLHEVLMPPGEGPPGTTGWTWRFDPYMWTHYKMGNAGDDLERATCPVAFIWGALSSLIDDEVAGYIASRAAPGTPMVEIPDAHHHVMLDQPLAFVTAIRGLLAGWPGQG